MKIKPNTERGGIILIIVVIVVIIGSTILVAKKIIDKVDGDIRDRINQKYEDIDPDEDRTIYLPEGELEVETAIRAQSFAPPETWWYIYATDDLAWVGWQIDSVYCTEPAIKEILWELVQWDVRMQGEAPEGTWNQKRLFYIAYPD